MTTCGQCTWLDVQDKGSSCRDTGVTPNSVPCRSFRLEAEDVGRISKSFSDVSSFTRYDWLPTNYSKAFMVCIGAGPWKFPRRKHVQGQALAWLGAKELEDVITVDCYPLMWQNKTVASLSAFLRSTRTTMLSFCKSIISESADNPAGAKRKFYSACGNPEGFKVLSLFCRDSLCIEAFPIDRHVTRRLELYNLPKHENALVHLCRKAELNTRDVATAFVQSGVDGKGLDTGNPNWSLEK